MQIKKLLFAYYSWLTYNLSYYFGNIVYPMLWICVKTDKLLGNCEDHKIWGKNIDVELQGKSEVFAQG